jgi:hypothetical protein
VRLRPNRASRVASLCNVTPRNRSWRPRPFYGGKRKAGCSAYLQFRFFLSSRFSVNPVKRRPLPLSKSDRRTPNDKPRASNAERRTRNAEHRPLNAERRTRKAERLLVVALCIAACTLTGCNNRTRDAVRWDQIAEAQRTDKNVQPWSEASRPWANVQYHTGTAW